VPVLVEVSKPEHARIDEHVAVAAGIGNVVSLATPPHRVGDAEMDFLAGTPLAAHLTQSTRSPFHDRTDAPRNVPNTLALRHRFPPPHRQHALARVMRTEPRVHEASERLTVRESALPASRHQDPRAPKPVPSLLGYSEAHRERGSTLTRALNGPLGLVAQDLRSNGSRAANPVFALTSGEIQRRLAQDPANHDRVLGGHGAAPDALLQLGREAQGPPERQQPPQLLRPKANRARPLLHRCLPRADVRPERLDRRERLGRSHLGFRDRHERLPCRLLLGGSRPNHSAPLVDFDLQLTHYRT
jgi:hypothetical protein